MKQIIVIVLILFYGIPGYSQEETSMAMKLRCEYLDNPQGIDRLQPRLSWQMRPLTGRVGQKVTAYRILVASSVDVLTREQGDLWDTGKIEGDQPVCVTYTGKPLQSFQNCYWQVRLWDEHGKQLPWSKPASWSMGILNPAEWQGQWLGYCPENLHQEPFAGEWFDKAHWIWHNEDDPDNVPGGVRYFKREIEITNITAIEWAEILVTANDAFQLSVNDQPLHSEMIILDPAEPGPRFNITSVLRSGTNVIAVKAEKLAPVVVTEKIKQVAGLLGVIKIKYRGREVETIVTDGKWQARTSEQDNWTGARDLGGAHQHWRQIPGWRQIHPGPIFRKEFTITQKATLAKIAICGLGYYELYCNGQKVGENRLDPAFTNYEHRVLYVCHDLTGYLRQGKNVIGVMLGNGWYNMHSRATWDFDRAPWRDNPKMIAQLLISHQDGSRQTIVTDQSWRSNTGPVRKDGIRHGEIYDARLELPDWNTPDFNDSDWALPQIVRAPRGKLVSQVMPAIKITETIKPVAITEPQPGIYVIDLGQNLAGWARIRVSGPTGTTIRLRYSERIDPNGMINQSRNRRYLFQGPFQTDVYILKGQGTEVWEPRFTYHGFRYLEVTSWPGKLTADHIEGRVAHTGFERIGNFACSDTLLNTIYTLTDRSYKSNFFGYPTDCPQREKNGWTGDAHLAAEQAMYNYHNLNAYDKWAYDLWDARTPAGDLPGIVPTGGWGYHKDNGPGWGSAAVLIPWYLYLYYGDPQLLEDHYDLMKGYVDFLHNAFPTHIVEMGRGDWCYLFTRTPGRVTSTALFCDDTRIVARAARVLDRLDEAEKYQALAAEIKTAYHREFYQGDGIYDPGSQTSQAISLFYGLVPDSAKKATIARLVDVVHKANDHIDCGILGAKALLQTLTENGHHELAYTIASQPDFPGYGDWIARGATTLWEDWTDNEGSLNHVMFGDIVTWFFRSLAGINIDPDQPGFKHIIIRPGPVADLTYAAATTESMYGTIRSNWRIRNGKFSLSVTIPPNATATIYLPNGEVHRVESGEYWFEVEE